MQLRVEPEFQNILPPLTKEEYERLEKEILSDGRLREPIVVWNGVIVDGHHRFKIIQEHPEIELSIVEKDFSDKWEAFAWMYDNQMGRRNLNDAQRTYLLGKLYEARKHCHGYHTDKRNLDGTFQCSQNGDTGEFNRISEQIANEQKIGKNTVLRSEQYAQGIDAIRKVEPGLAGDILDGKKKPTKKEIMIVGKAQENELPNMVDTLKKGFKIELPNENSSTPKRYNGGGTKEYREEMNQIAERVESLYDTTPMQYNIDSLITDIQNNAKSYNQLFNHILTNHKELCEEHKDRVIDAINVYIVHEINLLKEKIRNGEWT